MCRFGMLLCGPAHASQERAADTELLHAAPASYPALLATQLGEGGGAGWRARCGPCCKAWFRRTSAKAKLPGAGALTGSGPRRRGALPCRAAIGPIAAETMGARPAPSFGELARRPPGNYSEMAMAPAPKLLGRCTPAPGAQAGAPDRHRDRPWVGTLPTFRSPSGWGVRAPRGGPCATQRLGKSWTSGALSSGCSAIWLPFWGRRP